MNFLDSLGDGWTIYLWLVVGALIIAASIYGIRWAARNEQFDEDIKYLVFSESDKDKMSPEEYAKSREVLATQEASRERVLKAQAEERNRAA
ncbi:MAG: hypothetical protein KGM40_02510 [Betaproteobacteria bacterium]|nr:hypothetical protein [Betaproteobacteria bacterium]MDE1981217.1 hypothetical protein [Betaproteobacteria bacterium]MDE2624272.1 hypothetical protein [Betaproteobacteria bacterium]